MSVEVEDQVGQIVTTVKIDVPGLVKAGIPKALAYEYVRAEFREATAEAVRLVADYWA